MGWIVQDRASGEFLEMFEGSPDFTPRVDRATAFLDRDEAVLAALSLCDLAGFSLREVVDKATLRRLDES